MRIELPSDPTSPSLARRAVHQACEGLAVDLDAVLLCTSEVVTNALLHGIPPMELEVSIGDSWVRIAVHDRGRGDVERRRQVRPDTLSGRGLGIVEMLASRWGSEHTAGGKAIWFEIAAGG